MKERFMLVGVDDKNGFTTIPIAKRRFESYDEACDHAKVVMGSGGNLNLMSILVVQTIAIAQRVSPPIEITPLDRKV